MSYALPQDFINRVDSRRLGDLGLDDGTRVTAANLLTNVRLQAVLDDASGMIDAALLRSGRYAPSDLTTLASTTSFGNQLLIRICVDMSYGLLLEARGYSESETSIMSPGYTRALAYLDRLSLGEWIFGILPVVAAGQTYNQQLDTQITLLTGYATRYFGQQNYQQQGTNTTPPLTSQD